MRFERKKKNEILNSRKNPNFWNLVLEKYDNVCGYILKIPNNEIRNIFEIHHEDIMKEKRIQRNFWNFYEENKKDKTFNEIFCEFNFESKYAYRYKTFKYLAKVQERVDKREWCIYFLAGFKSSCTLDHIKSEYKNQCKKKEAPKKYAMILSNLWNSLVKPIHAIDFDFEKLLTPSHFDFLYSQFEIFYIRKLKQNEDYLQSSKNYEKKNIFVG